MIQTKLLSEAEFGNTCDPPMKRLPLDAEPPFDFWSYFDSISPEDFQGCVCSGDVDYAYRNASNSYIHVLVNTEHRNRFMVVVLQIGSNTVAGHYLLNLDEKYGITLDEEREA